MKNTYLILALLGLVLPNVLVIQESVETGNILLYAQPLHTFQQLFANRISSIFALDLLYGVAVFFLWSYGVSKREGVRHLGWVWLGTMGLGFAFGLPLFLYLWECQRLASKG